MTLEELYRQSCETPSDINEHCPVLYDLAKECDHVTEFGTRWGVSTSALLYAQPKKLVCYDIGRRRSVSILESLAGDTEFEFHKADVLEIEIEPTDFLFIDTWHAYVQLKKELELHAVKAKKIMAFHDTVKFARRGDTCKGTRDPGGGLMDAIDEFLEGNEQWKIEKNHQNNNGLMVHRRVQ